MNNPTKVRVEGHIYSHLHITTGKVECGSIRNGIGLWFGNAQKPVEGGWVVSFSDLEKVYAAAKKARQR